MYALRFLHIWFFLTPFTGHHFNYENPHKWFLASPQCAGQKQSPVALFSRKAIVSDLAPLTFQYYDLPLVWPITLVNNGHTAQVTIGNANNGARPSVSGGGVNDVYEAQNVHFHWGSRSSKGTEHAINGKKYDLEMHIVHKNIRFPTMAEALDDPYGLVVLGILFKRSESASSNNSTGLNAIFDSLPYLIAGESMQFLNQSITMQSFLGDLKTEQFYTYRGSLTTPPCSEVVTWFVFPDILPIKSEHLERFFNLEDDEERPLLNNYRPLQSSFLRRVYYRKGGE